MISAVDVDADGKEEVSRGCNIVVDDGSKLRVPSQRTAAISSICPDEALRSTCRGRSRKTLLLRLILPRLLPLAVAFAVLVMADGSDSTGTLDCAVSGSDDASWHSVYRRRVPSCHCAWKSGKGAFDISRHFRPSGRGRDTGAVCASLTDGC